MYDIIGDIHGHADKLIALLQKMDYQRVGSSWRHPDGRRLVFAGDYIDRGPGIEQVLQTVRACVDAGDADAIMGNHEFNAMAMIVYELMALMLRISIIGVAYIARKMPISTARRWSN